MKHFKTKEIFILFNHHHHKNEKKNVYTNIVLFIRLISLYNRIKTSTCIIIIIIILVNLVFMLR